MKGNLEFKQPNQHYISFFYDRIIFSCIAGELLLGIEKVGQREDLILFDECQECCNYENIRKVEITKQMVEVRFLIHIVIAKNIYHFDSEASDELGLNNIDNSNLTDWIEHVKKFYLNILSRKYIYDIMERYGVNLDVIEPILEMLMELEEYNLDNYKSISEDLN